MRVFYTLLRIWALGLCGRVSGGASGWVLGGGRLLLLDGRGVSCGVCWAGGRERLHRGPHHIRLTGYECFGVC